MKKIDVSVIYVFYNTPKEIFDSINSLPSAIGNLNFEIIIIDNNSPKKLPALNHNIKIISNKVNHGYGKALNQGSRIAEGEFLLLTNPDTIFQEKSIYFLVEKIRSDNDIGIIGPKFMDKNKKTLITGNGNPFLPGAIFSFTILGKIFNNISFIKEYFLSEFNRDKESNIPVICGASMLISKNLFFQVNGFDEQFFLYFEESDLCYRVNKLGYKVLYYPKSEVIHLGSKSSNNNKKIRRYFEDSRYKFFKKYQNKYLSWVGETLIRLLNR